ncbi:hypothetical protein [Streptomyces sp. NPDC053427]|uniref:hypothetical protein n=1 Tax=Streptomyces sp. NPDC053427 TaxID=3365701 RepID=UPI0037CDF957
MAGSRFRGRDPGRFLLVVAALVAVVLVLPVGAWGGYGEAYEARAAAARTAAGGSGPGAAAATPATPDSHDPPEAAADRYRPRRGGRSAAAVSAPPPLSTPLSTASPVRHPDGLPGSVPLTGRQAVPLSRSSELPVQHHVFRC